MKAEFIEALALTGNVSEAARAISKSRSRAYEFYDEEPEFAALWDEAEAIAADALETEARCRGVEGWEEPVYYKGDIVGHIRKYSDRMLELLIARAASLTLPVSAN